MVQRWTDRDTKGENEIWNKLLFNEIYLVVGYYWSSRNAVQTLKIKERFNIKNDRSKVINMMIG